MSNIVIHGLKATWGLILQGFSAGTPAGSKPTICRSYNKSFICQRLLTKQSICQRLLTTG